MGYILPLARFVKKNNSVEEKSTIIAQEEIVRRANHYAPSVVKNGVLNNNVLSGGFRDLVLLYSDLLEQNVEYVKDLPGDTEKFTYDAWDRASLHSLLSHILGQCGGKEKVIAMIRSVFENSYDAQYAKYLCDHIRLV